MRRILLVLALTFVIAPMALAQEAKPAKMDKMAMPAMAEMGFYRAGEIDWKEGPASLPAGAKAAVIGGDPAKAGVFTMRVMLPDGYVVPPHFHSQIENVTVLSGKFILGMGEKFDKTDGRELGVGDFFSMPIGMRHFVRIEGDTVIQIHGQGPWTITYVNSQDDPRNKK